VANGGAGGYASLNMTRLGLVALAGLSIATAAGCGAAQEQPTTPRALPSVGTEVPALTRVDQRGQVVALRAGVPTLLYFFPKSGTPGCTKEACAIRDAWDDYLLSGLRVIGVSIDSDEVHRAFADEHGLPFSLVADPMHAWSDAFGVGTFNGLDERVSFLIDPNNRIAKVYEDVDPGVYAQ
jgi:thioredoxin-dependent peroxiredoxin